MSKTIDSYEVDRLAEAFQAFTGKIAPIAGGYIIGESDEDYEKRREEWLAFCFDARSPKPRLILIKPDPSPPKEGLLW